LYTQVATTVVQNNYELYVNSSKSKGVPKVSINSNFESVVQLNDHSDDDISVKPDNDIKSEYANKMNI